MEAWQVVTAVSGAVVALVVGGGAVVGIVRHPFAQLRAEIGRVRTEGQTAHEQIGTNINGLGDRLEEKLDRLGERIDTLSQEVAGVRENVARMDGVLPQIDGRLSKLET